MWTPAGNAYASLASGDRTRSIAASYADTFRVVPFQRHLSVAFMMLPLSYLMGLMSIVWDK